MEQRNKLMPAAYLVDLEELDVSVGAWNYGKGMLGNPANSKIEVNGKQSLNGLGMHPPDSGTASVKYKLDKAFRVFDAAVALNDTSPGAAPVSFQVVGDGRVLWTSAQVQKARFKQACGVNVAGITTLELRVICSGGAAGAHAIWIEPRVSK
jgi:hypothetical protein